MRLAWGVAVLAATAVAGAAAAAEPAPRAAGGVRLLHALESAPATVVGLVAEPRELDRHGHAATLRVETPVAGGLERGAEVTIAWEELARDRAPRFAEGDRILVSLERLPPESIWRTRIPDPAVRTATLHVAESGDAFLRDPTLFGVSLLEHYARLGPEGRASPTGARYLARLAAGAQPPLARSAVERLAELPRLPGLLTEEEGALLVQALLRPDAPGDLREALVSLFGQRQLEAARPALEAEARRGEEADAVVFRALGGLDGELSPERTEQLLAHGGVPVREAAARFAGGPGAAARLRRLIAGDPAPEVRAAAVERLAALEPVAALDPLARALGDPDERVRNAAARAAGSLGESAVPRLRGVLESGSEPAARAAVAALLWTGSPEAARVLAEVADAHPDPAVRLLARIALSRPIGDTHERAAEAAN